MICIYLLKSKKDNKQYVGSTNNFKRRLNEHSKGIVKSTKYRRPMILVGYQICNNVQEAAQLEKKYKRSHGALNRAIRNKSFTMVESAGAAQRALPGGV